MLQQSQRLRRELNSQEAKPRGARAAVAVSRTQDLQAQQTENYLATPRLPKAFALRQAMVRVCSASRVARSAYEPPISVSSSARHHPNRGGVARRRRWRRDDCHHPGSSCRVSLRKRRQSSLGTRNAGSPPCPVLPNPSLKRSANGRPPGPGRRYAVHFRRPGPGVLPLSPA